MALQQRMAGSASPVNKISTQLSVLKCEKSQNRTMELSHASPDSRKLKLTATAGSDVVKSERPIFDDFFQHLWPYIGNNTANVVFQMVKSLSWRPIHRVQIVRIRRSPNVSFNQSIVALSCCDMLRRLLLEPQLLDMMIVQFRNEKLVIMALYRSPLTVTLWPSSFFEEGFHQPIKRTKRSQFFWM
ncbi:hypothetical protein TNCV_3292301 [Trichonephila clavipes]|nr:hypothetical protein TNCV_3292301 [Trichonephila clavipes]